MPAGIPEGSSGRLVEGVGTAAGAGRADGAVAGSLAGVSGTSLCPEREVGAVPGVPKGRVTDLWGGEGVGEMAGDSTSVGSRVGVSMG